MQYLTVPYRKAYNILYEENYVRLPNQSILNKYVYYYIKYSPDVDPRGLCQRDGKIKIPLLSIKEQMKVINDLGVLNEKNDTLDKLINLYKHDELTDFFEHLKAEYKKNKDKINTYVWYLD